MAGISVILEAELAPPRLDGLTRDLMRDLGRAGVPAQPAEAPAGPGERGVMASVGTFVIDQLGGKTAAAVLDVAKAYLTREQSLHISMVKPDGTKIDIDAKNVGSAAVAEFLSAAKTVTG
jgi:hypothetical protein